jgi:FMN reductase [NAD(P)H]
LNVSKRYFVKDVRRRKDYKASPKERGSPFRIGRYSADKPVQCNVESQIEDWKLEMIFAAADTAPTAGGFQGFEVFNVKNTEVKNKLVNAANNQPYVNAPVVLVFCMNPSRVKMNFPQHIIKKFSVQDATLAAAYAQLAAHALGLTSVWIGMIDEQKVMQALVTDLIPAVILCLGYSQKMLHPKPKRKLTELINEI